MIILALDTSQSAASVCVWDSEARRSLAAHSLTLARGHDTILIQLVGQSMEEAGVRFADLARIATTIGPGSFTGLRIGVSAARAFGLAAGVPVVGVSTLAALAAAELPSPKAKIIAAVDARKNRVFAQIFSPEGRPEGPERLAAAEAIVAALEPGPIRLIGSGAAVLATACHHHGRAAEVAQRPPHPNISVVARLGVLADAGGSPPAPVYLEAAAVTLPRSAASRTAAAPGTSR